MWKGFLQKSYRKIKQLHQTENPDKNILCLILLYLKRISGTS
ncbi:hypothetical protein AQPE_2973 [Aquipluma nitroreducens]|uniref:Uncharacterized protein n=1 Tax=Aquipluma nitroreducens TaxID=2010828 RepID=A0A5K7SBC0_9BACT|nr:hypothetical protein AQPE_2973 [Aquipluma nitroreducens]